MIARPDGVEDEALVILRAWGAGYFAEPAARWFAAASDVLHWDEERYRLSVERVAAAREGAALLLALLGRCPLPRDRARWLAALICDLATRLPGRHAVLGFVIAAEERATDRDVRVWSEDSTFPWPTIVQERKGRTRPTVARRARRERDG